MAYTAIYLASGYLPWGDLFDESKKVTNVDDLIVRKSICGAKVLCFGLPSVFRDLASHVMSLKNSASVQDVLYAAHIAAFREFAHSKH
jgi:hypothetical protein